MLIIMNRRSLRPSLTVDWGVRATQALTEAMEQTRAEMDYFRRLSRTGLTI